MNKNGSNLWQQSSRAALEAVQKVPSLAKRSAQELRTMKSPIKSVGMKLFVIFFSSILFFVLAVGFISYYKSKGIIQNKVSDAAGQTIAQTNGKLDLLFQSFEDLSLQLFLDPNVQDGLQKMNDTAIDDYDRLESTNKLSKMVNNFAFTNSAIYAVHLLSLNNKKSFSTTSIEIKDLTNLPWVKSVIDKNGGIVWLDTKLKNENSSATESAKPTFGLSRELVYPGNGKADFVLFIEFHLKALQDAIANVKISKSDSILILNSSNQIIYSPNSSEIGKQSAVTIPLDPKTHKPLVSGSFTTRDKSGSDQLVVYNQSAKTGWYLIGSAPVNELVGDAKQILNITIIIALIAALIAVAIGFFVARMIGAPLIMLRNLMDRGEQGDLSVRTANPGRDEIGQVGQKFNQMMEQITQLVRRTNASAQEVLGTAAELADTSKKTAYSAREIAVATEEIANGASSLAMEAERGNDLTHNISSQMKLVVEANTQMGSSAFEVRKVSEQGTVYMADLISKTNTTEVMIRSMADKVDKLKESTQSIRKILDVLNNMTRQTNILSLNATIEAARAGAAGKGFMVVADEIRKLADQSRQSIDVVGQITETIQKEIDETVNVLSNAYPIFKDQITSVKEANQIFTTVQNHMGGFIQQLDGVTNSIQQLDQSQVVLSVAMSNVSAVSEQSSATSQEVASLSSEQLNISQGLVLLSEKLENVSAALKDSLSRFSI